MPGFQPQTPASETTGGAGPIAAQYILADESREIVDKGLRLADRAGVFNEAVSYALGVTISSRTAADAFNSSSDTATLRASAAARALINDSPYLLDLAAASTAMSQELAPNVTKPAGDSGARLDFYDDWSSSGVSLFEKFRWVDDGRILIGQPNSTNQLAIFSSPVAHRFQEAEFVGVFDADTAFDETVGSLEDFALSPDGKIVILLFTNSGSRYLRRIDLDRPYDFFGRVRASNDELNISSANGAAQSFDISEDGMFITVLGSGGNASCFRLDDPFSVAAYNNVQGITVHSSATVIRYLPGGGGVYVAAGSSGVFSYTFNTYRWYGLITAATSFDQSTLNLTAIVNNSTCVQMIEDGSRFVILNGSRFVVLSMPTPKDLSTCRCSDEYLPSSVVLDSTPRGATFNLDGSRVYYVGSSNDYAYQHDLEDNHSLGTADAGASVDITAQVSNPTAIQFTANGSHMFVLDDGTDSIHCYSLSTPGDAETQTFVASFALGSGVWEAMWLSRDADYIAVLNRTTNAIQCYAFGSALDVTSLVLDSTLSLAAYPHDVIMSFVVSLSGRRVYLFGGTLKLIYVEEMSTPWDFDTAKPAKQCGDLSLPFLNTPLRLDASPDLSVFIGANSSDHLYPYRFKMEVV